MQLGSMVLRSLSLAFLVCIVLAFLSSMAMTSNAASILGVPGAWLGIALFGEGHDWEHLAGVVFGELLFFFLVFMIAQLAYLGYLRMTDGVANRLGRR